MTHPTESVRRFYDALGRGDVATVLALLAPGRAGLAQLTYAREIDPVEAQPTYAAVRDANRTASRPRAGLPGACATGAPSADTARR
jgi:hypothetical protein